MGLVGIVLCVVAFFMKKSNRDGAKKCMNFALVFYGIGVVLMLIRSGNSVYSLNGFGLVIVITAFFLMIAGRLRLEEEPSNKSDGALRASATIDRVINYKKLANEIFDISMELSKHTGKKMEANGIPYFSAFTREVAPSFGTALYEYSVILLREKMKKIYTNKVEFESEDNIMIEAFAKKLKVPAPAFLKIVDRNGGKKEWDNLLSQTKDIVPIDEYVDEVRVVINKATRGVVPVSEIEGVGEFEDIERERKKKERKEAREERYRRKQLERQLRYDRWQRLRHEFDELKKTDQFKRWKAEEYICQDKKCAWCKKPIGLHTQYTHVDHIVPLFYGGDNSASNLVLTCSSCNKAKGYKTYGYNDSWEGDKNHRVGRNERPSWIAPNKYDSSLDGAITETTTKTTQDADEMSNCLFR